MAGDRLARGARPPSCALHSSRRRAEEQRALAGRARRRDARDSSGMCGRAATARGARLSNMGSERSSSFRLSSGSGPAVGGAGSTLRYVLLSSPPSSAPSVGAEEAALAVASTVGSASATPSTKVGASSFCCALSATSCTRARARAPLAPLTMMAHAAPCRSSCGGASHRVACARCSPPRARRCAWASSRTRTAP